MSTLRETAEKLAEGWTNQEYLNAKLADAIEQALRNERERAAKIADEEGCGEAEDNCCCAQNVAAAIRKDD